MVWDDVAVNHTFLLSSNFVIVDASWSWFKLLSLDSTVKSLPHQIYMYKHHTSILLVFLLPLFSCLQLYDCVYLFAHSFPVWCSYSKEKLKGWRLHLFVFFFKGLAPKKILKQFHLFYSNYLPYNGFLLCKKSSNYPCSQQQTRYTWNKTYIKF